MHSQPLFIVGAPRSGTTFLCHVLNQDTRIELTNECRIFVAFKDLIETRAKRPDLVGQPFRDPFVLFMRERVGELVERFYRETLGVTAPIWGDKHPPYADPSVLSGRRRSAPRLPKSGSCLRLIASSLPTAKFIHIHRNPREVAHSLVLKGWTPSVEDGLQVWRQYVEEVVAFMIEIDADRHLTIAYRDLIEEPAGAAARIGGFLGLPDCAAIAEFLLMQRQSPTPFSDPVTDVGQAFLRKAAPPGLNRQALALAGRAAARLGYAG
jgi:hypothetical protein